MVAPPDDHLQKSSTMTSMRAEMLARFIQGYSGMREEPLPLGKVGEALDDMMGDPHPAGRAALLFFEGPARFSIAYDGDLHGAITGRKSLFVGMGEYNPQKKQFTPKASWSFYALADFGEQVQPAEALMGGRHAEVRGKHPVILDIYNSERKKMRVQLTFSKDASTNIYLLRK